MTDNAAIAAVKAAIIAILSADPLVTGIVPPEHIYDTDWAFRTANLFPGISVEESRSIRGSYATGMKELIPSFSIRCYSENFEASAARAQAMEITNNVAEVLEKRVNLRLNNTASDSEVIDINYNLERAGASVKEVSWACEITFNAQLMLIRS